MYYAGRGTFMQAGGRGRFVESETRYLSSVIDSMLAIVASEGNLLDAIRAGADEVTIQRRLTPELCDRIAVAFVRSIVGMFHATQEARIVRVGHLALDLDTEAVLLHGRSLQLTPHHRRLLLRLARGSGRFVPVAELRECAGIQVDRENKNLRNQVWRLRKRLAEAECRLEGAARQGYRLVPASRSSVARTS
jgi:DNA-binding response OmpR family regulator